MRTSVTASVMACLLWAAAGRADDQAEARAIVDKAVKAMGRDKLEQNKAATWKGKGKIFFQDQAIDFTSDWFVEPGKQRADFELDFMGMKIKQSRVVNGDKGWTKTNDTVDDMDKETLAEEKHSLYAQRVGQLLVLRDPAYQLSLLGDSKVGDRPAVGVKVAHAGQRDIRLFFDKETGYLLKSEGRVKDVQSGGTEMTNETFYLDYKDASGLREPGKIQIKRDGKLFLEFELSDFQRKPKLDDSVFNQ
jgi:hypothetical protein